MSIRSLLFCIVNIPVWSESVVQKKLYLVQDFYISLFYMTVFCCDSIVLFTEDDCVLHI